MRRLLFVLSLVFVGTLSAPAGQQFAAVAFHDVVDFRGDLDDEAVTVDRLIGFFEWLRANRWTAISLDDVAAARRGEKSLPERAILITFDDGYRSVYTRVFPLVLAYRIPIVIALVGEWLETPMDGKVRYGGREIARSKFLNWNELCELSESGLVEIASHTYDLHRGILGNPQGNEMPAAANRRYARDGGYESAAAYRRRIADDLSKSRNQIASHFGRPPRTIVWPYGRYNGVGVEVANDLGFEFALTLDPEPADASEPMAIGRFLPTNDPKLADMVSQIRLEDPLPRAQRLVALNPAEVWAGDSASMDDRLGRVIERLRRLGATGVVVDAVTMDADGKLNGAWFPNGQLPMHADILPRLAWQCQWRGGVKAYVRLPSRAALSTFGDRGKVRALFRDLGIHVPMSGILIDDAPELARVGLTRNPAAAPWETRRARNAVRIDSLPSGATLALEAFRAMEFFRPGLQLVLVTDLNTTSRPATIADLTLLPLAPNPREVKRLSARLQAEGWLAPQVARRFGLWFTSARPPSERDLVSATRIFQIQGGTAIGWAVDDPIHDQPAAKIVAPAVSAATFPDQF